MIEFIVERKEVSHIIPASESLRRRAEKARKDKDFKRQRELELEAFLEEWKEEDRLRKAVAQDGYYCV